MVFTPPYVRMELIKADQALSRQALCSGKRPRRSLRLFLRARALAAQGRRAARFHFVLDLLPHRLGRAPLRRWLSEGASGFEAIVDFGDAQIFGGVTTYPAILTLEKGAGAGRTGLSRMKGPPPGRSWPRFRPRERRYAARATRGRLLRLEDDALAGAAATRSWMGARRSGRFMGRRLRHCDGPE